jgi:hypothetical protein
LQRFRTNIKRIGRMLKSNTIQIEIEYGMNVT